MTESSYFGYDKLDPGVREFVRFLREHGYVTTDSGDGVSKPPEARTMDFAHVVVRLPDEFNIAAKANILVQLCRRHGYPNTVVEASYSTEDKIALLIVRGFES